MEHKTDASISKKTIKSHPIMIMHFLSRYILLLIIPSLKSIASFFASGSLKEDSVWYLFFMALIVIISILKLLRCRIYALKTHIRTRQGLFFMKENMINLDKISNITAYSGILLHLLKAVYVKIDTEAGKRKKSDFEIIMSKDDYNFLVNMVFREGKSTSEFLFSPEKICIMALSATSVITGSALMFSVINYVSQITEENIADKLYESINNTVSLLDFILPRAIGVIAALAAAGFIFSFSYTLFKYSNFYVSRNECPNGAFIYISCGLISKKEIRLKESCTAAAFIIRRPLMSLLRHDITRIYAAGYGSSKSELSVLLPATGRDKTFGFINSLLTNMQYTSPSLIPSKGKEHKFILPQIICIILLPIAAGVLSLFVGIHNEDLFFVILILLGIIVIWLLSGYFASKNSGIHFDKSSSKTISFRTTKYSCNIMAMVSTDNISFIKITQSPFEIKSRLCSVKVYIYSGERINCKIKALRYHDAAALLKNET
mgnify:FL=1